MRLHRFYISQKVGGQTEISLPEADLAHQLGNVFRLKAGDQVIIFDGTGFEYVSQIVTVSRESVTLSILEAVNKLSEEYVPKISLYLALIKKGNFELAVEKCTEIGVTEIHPVVSERSEKKDINFERLGKIVKEASEQCGRVTLPEVFHVTDLEIAVSQAVKDGRECFVFHTGLNLKIEQVTGVIKNKQVAVFVGPEGGWTDKEVELFKKYNCVFHTLGVNTLRAETAAIVAVSKFVI